MISSALNHIKFSRLKRRLKLKQWEVVGLLEGVWLFAQHNATDGAIGRHSNEDIAAWLEWEDDADELIESLVASGWLDRSDAHRILIHDWAEHAPRWVKGNIAKAGREMAAEIKEAPYSAKEAPREPPREAPREPPRDVPYSAKEAPPSLTKPREEKPKEKKQAVACAPAPVEMPEILQDSAEFAEAWAAWLTYRRELKKPITPSSEKQLLRKFAEWGPQRAASAIYHSVANNWQGCFEPKGEAEHGNAGGRTGLASGGREEERLNRSLTACAEFAESG